MSAPLPVSLAEPLDATPTTHGRERWRRWRLPLAASLAVVVSAVVGLILLRPTSGGLLDPQNYGPKGARALAEVLRTHGVDIKVRTRFVDVDADLAGSTSGIGTTVVVARTDLLVGERTQDLRRAVEDAGADLVLVGAGPALLADLGLPLVAEPVSAPAVRDPQCSDLIASRAGPALTGGLGYRPAAGTDQAVTSCYPTGGAAGYVALTGPGGGRTTLLGDGGALTNERLTGAGNAALALGTLGARQQVSWWTPNPADTGVTVPPTLRELLPRGVPWAVAQLAVALVVAALWRGRRLGRLVTEPLPVVVRSVETTLGRARLYRRARARGRAAQVLRAAAVHRIAVRCNLSRSADPREVAVVAAGRVRRPAADVEALLVGVDPPDDTALVTLARALHALETEVRHP